MGDMTEHLGLWLYLVTFGLALLVSFYMVPIVRQIALKTGLLDRPDGQLKTQSQPVPYLGGLAIYLGFLVSLSLTVDFQQEVLGMLLPATLVLLLGLIDDIGGIAPGPKMIGQFVAVCVLIKSGIWVQISALPMWVDILLTAIVIIAISNALNVIDVMDGLAGGITVIAAMLFFVVALHNNNHVMAMMAVAIAGSVVGFLRHNFPPATIYMGDAGSLFLGFMLGALAVNGQYTDIHGMGLVTPMLILGIPIFDTLLVMAVRAVNGHPVYFGSPDHFALRLRRLAWSVKGIVISSYTVAIVLGGMALAIMYAPLHIAMVLTAVATIFLMAVGVWLFRIPKQQDVQATVEKPHHRSQRKCQ